MSFGESSPERNQRCDRIRNASGRLRRKQRTCQTAKQATDSRDDAREHDEAYACTVPGTALSCELEEPGKVKAQSEDGANKGCESGAECAHGVWDEDSRCTDAREEQRIGPGVRRVRFRQ